MIPYIIPHPNFKFHVFHSMETTIVYVMNAIDEHSPIKWIFLLIKYIE